MSLQTTIRANRKSRKIILEFVSGVFFLAGTVFCLFILYAIASVKYREVVIPYAEGRLAKCKQYGDLPIDQFFRSYTVKPGDSLTAIAQKELGDIHRAEDIIRLNKEILPSYSVYSPMALIEPGWVLRLPKDKNRDITEYASGHFYWGHTDELFFSWDGSGGGPPWLERYTIVSGAELMKPGICARILYTVNRETQKAEIFIEKQ